ncbi:glucose dehydrogenase [FAD, quinone]-like [Lutzomyia longipalpis]|uniref:glucose dehydrogenase [FAD, quinone]-like n=1 Tax=Lutzomyia longipalpis TaxID=7200 RepID=UPI002483750F|nr:glucose dehydrogenase [FAD, quinone]-like [Lutzomyia longipalpis]
MNCSTPPCGNLSAGAANQYLSLLFNYLTIAQCSLSPPEMWPADYGDIAIKRGFPEYDFIIVGAGSAGCVLADRLSENPKWKVLVVEAGGDPPIEATIPGLYPSMMRTSYDWEYYCEPSEKYGLFSRNGIYWPRGKMLGGSGTHNGMLYIRGNEKNYNDWEALGNPTWEFTNVLQYFKKSEANKDPEIADDFGGYYHSKDGLLSVELYRDNQSINYDFIQAANELGFNFVRDVNARDHIGFTFSQGTLKSGLRDSTATAFLVPAKDRPNLHVVKYAHVTKLEIDSNGVVTGIRLNLHGKKDMIVHAKKEVILSGGTINSPQILMLSGIGPAAHLQEMGIPVIQNLQVGKNLQDHPIIPILVKLNNVDTLPETPADVLKYFYQYLTEHSGILASVSTTQTLGFVNVDDPFSKYPNVQYYHLYFNMGQVNEILATVNMMGYADNILEIITSLIQQSHVLMLIGTVITPQSRGEILLRSSESAEKPRIFPNYLSEKSDLENLIKSIRLGLKLLDTPTYRKLGGELFVIPIPECDALEFDSDDYWACYIKYMISTVYHPVGTNKMGPDTDPDAVVDYRLRVKGTKGLRVVDASIMPVITSGNTNAPTIMIAEKGADFIKEDWVYTL